MANDRTPFISAKEVKSIRRKAHTQILLTDLKVVLHEIGLCRESVLVALCAMNEHYILDSKRLQKKKLRKIVADIHTSKSRGKISGSGRIIHLADILGSLYKRCTKTILARVLGAENHLRCEPKIPSARLSMLYKLAESYDLTLPVEQLVRIPATDEGNAERFAKKWYRKLLYCNELSTSKEKSAGWFEYTGTHWTEVPPGAIAMYVNVMLTDFAADEHLRRKLYPDYEFIAASKKGQPWYIALQASQRITVISKLAQGLPQMTASINDFDTKLTKFNTPSGVINLPKKKLSPHKPSQRFRYITNISFNPKAKDKKWNDFLAEATGYNVEHRRFLQRFIGMVISGERKEAKFGVIVGKGNNGKTVFLEACRHVLGTYARTVGFETFLQSGAQSNTTMDSLATLAGVRLVCAGETTQGARFNTACVKTFTGGDTVTARRLFGSVFEYHPVGTLLFVSNFKPHIPYNDEAMWRRVIQIPFTSEPKKRDRGLLDYFKTDKHAKEAILAWGVKGYYMYKAEGLRIPQEIKEITKQYRKGEDTLSQFLGDCCVEAAVVDGKVRVMCSNKLIQEAYHAWEMSTSGRRGMGRNALIQELENRGYVKRKLRGKLDDELTSRLHVGWLGIKYTSKKMYDRQIPVGEIAISATNYVKNSVNHG